MNEAQKQDLVKTTTSTITKMIKLGQVCRETPNEQPTYENIEKGILQVIAYSALKCDINSGELEDVCKEIYCKLRKNGSLAKLRIK